MTDHARVFGNKNLNIVAIIDRGSGGPSSLDLETHRKFICMHTHSAASEDLAVALGLRGIIKQQFGVERCYPIVGCQRDFLHEISCVHPIHQQRLGSN